LGSEPHHGDSPDHHCAGRAQMLGQFLHRHATHQVAVGNHRQPGQRGFEHVHDDDRGGVHVEGELGLLAGDWTGGLRCASVSGMRLLMSVIHSADGRSTTSLRVHQHHAIYQWNEENPP